MSNVTVIGTQWGDEGKGKIVDWLASRADIVVRFQGGHNAGHTLVVGDQTYKLSLLPSGLVRGKTGVIGNGVVVDPEAFLAEVERVTAQGLTVSPETLWVADNAALILPVHVATDRAREAARGDRKIGTTGRGIGPAYEDKVARRAIRLCDLAEEETLDWKLDELLLHHNTLLAGLGAPTFTKQALKDHIARLAPRILPYGSANPPHGVSRQPKAALRVKALDRLHHPDIAFTDEFTDGEAVTTIAHRNFSDQAQMGCYKFMGCVCILPVSPKTGQAIFLIRCKKRKTADLL